MKGLRKIWTIARSNAKRFSTKVTVEESSEVDALKAPLAQQRRETNERISQLLEIPEIIDYGKDSLFRGNLILCPTPIGNLKDLSIRAYEALTTGDIIACEDTRVTGKLLTLLKQRKFDVQINAILTGEESGNEETAANWGTPEDHRDPAGEADEQIFALAIAKHTARPEPAHKNLFELKRLKKKMKDFYQENDINLAKELAKQRLIKDDSLGFLSKYETENKEDGDLGPSGSSDPGLAPEIAKYPFISSAALDDPTKATQKDDDDYFYDSSSKARKKHKEKFEKDPLDDPFISLMKQKIYESKLKKGRGLLISCHRFNENERIESLVKLMKAGLKVVLVPDAGSPCLSDPGQLLVNESIKNKIIVDALPGPNAVALALGLCGFPSDNYTFNGFFPKNEGERMDLIKSIKESRRTSVLFENKHRVMNLLLLLEKELGASQKIYLGVEMTKLHERNLQGTISKIYETLNKNPDYTVPSLKGEITVVVAPFTKEFNKDLVDLTNPLEGSLRESLKDHYSIRPGDLISILEEYVDVKTNELAHMVADILNINKKRAYDFVVKEQRRKQKQKKAEE